ncbi:MAG: hypothetical protein EA001_13015 [Oscillatoriales cyanobacterium]|nr:MAG: hypothetical protein EA001_13015 [Oscillatoriales cyanobacterium]
MFSQPMRSPFAVALIGALAAIPSLPGAAQARPLYVTCQTVASANQDATLTYRVTGSLPQATTGAVPQNPIGTSLRLTVQWQNRQGNSQVLLDESLLQDYAQLAPDADFSKLPFDSEFRGQPNQGDRLYAAPASLNGLYISLRPALGQPQQIQVLHYLGSGQFVRSTPGNCQIEVGSEDAAIRQQLALIQDRLQAQDWAAADRETRRLLAPESVFMPPARSVSVRPEVIRELDRAWLTASNGRFGLSIQWQLWRAARAAHPNNLEAAVNAFRDLVGWKIPAPRPEVDFISSDWRNESELTYSLQAPVGHLPWVGVSDQVVHQVAVPPEGMHCGSCSIDAIQLRHDRFYGYVPALMDRVRLSIDFRQPMPSPPGRSPQLRP